MRKSTALLLIFALVLSLAGCGLPGMENDLYRQDTVIYIPADPTTEATEYAAESTEPEPTETIPKPTLSFFPYFTDQQGTSNKTSSAKPAVKEPEATMAATEAPATAPRETEHLVYDVSDYAIGSLETSMMDAVNSHRREAGLPALEKNHRLSAIASVRAYEGSRSWSHTRPDGSDYTTVFGDYGFSAGTVGENLLYTTGGEDGTTLVSKWMNAETNRDNLMYEGFTAMGIGIYEANGYTYIACLLAG